MKKLENEERLDLGGGGHEKQEICMGEAEDKSWRVCVGEIYQVWSRRWMVEIEGQQMRRRERSRGVGMREDQAAGTKCVSNLGIEF